MAEDLGDKTEPASDRRRQELRREGTVPKSPDLSGAITLIGAILALVYFGPGILAEWQSYLRLMLDGQFGEPSLSSESLLHDLARFVVTFVRAAGPFLAAMVAVALFATICQVGFLWTIRPLQPKFLALNPLNGLKKFFGIRAGARAFIGLLKVSVVLVVAVFIVRRQIPEIISLTGMEYAEAIARAAQLVIHLAIWLLAVLTAIGLLDFIYQKWQWEHDNRMTRHEIKEEHRLLQGDPKIKSRQRSFARKILSQRLAQAVPKADVVITNPEHLAIALQWDSTSMSAPIVLAKGADYLALRIRQIALAHNVPILERRALARAMYPMVHVGKEIPPRFYTAVAEVLAYVYRLNERKAG